jgi:uncharacterized protein YecE (DUF72 family)
MRPAENSQKDRMGEIRVGVGGWTYAPWRGLFYPKEVTQKRELEFASRHLSSIEIDGTYYGTQKRESFIRWREETPDDFVFSVKGPRFATNRRVLDEAGESVERFLASGLTELREKLGPILWQMLPTKKLVEEDFAAFIELLPREHDGLALRHAVELRHESFNCDETVAIARKNGIAIGLAGDSKFPEIAACTAPFVYLRLMGSKASPKQGYSKAALDFWADRAKTLARGETPHGFAPMVETAKRAPRDVYVYFIAGHKAHNPAAAQALMERVKQRAPFETGAQNA